MMRIDAYTHFIPNRFYKEVLSAGSYADIGKRMKGVPCIYDLNIRLKVVDKFKDYAQVLSYGMPPREVMRRRQIMPAAESLLRPRMAMTFLPGRMRFVTSLAIDGMILLPV